jgi:hypothetical protein
MLPSVIGGPDGLLGFHSMTSSARTSRAHPFWRAFIVQPDLTYIGRYMPGPILLAFRAFVLDYYRQQAVRKAIHAPHG